MADNRYDVIVVGARCAGSPTAMLLARYGHRVLVVDRATFPSDTLSTHVVQPQGVAALRRWGLLGRVTASGCPPVDRYAFDFGPFTIAGAPGTEDAPVAYCPRRTVLDTILVQAASDSGAEVREGFTVEAVLADDDGRVVGVRGHGGDGGSVDEHAQIVIGADGRRSVVAEAVRPAQYHEKPQLLCGYYAYWSGLPLDNTFATYIRPNRGFAACPTNDGLTMVVAGWPFAEFAANRTDVEGNYLKTFQTAPEFAELIHVASRESRIAGTAVPNYFRTPFGPGWALVGDAGYNKDFITAQGISDAFRDADVCATAVHDALSGDRPFDDALGAYQAARDDHVLPMFEFTTQLATLQPPPPEMQQVLGAMIGNQPAMDQFARVNSGITSPAEFFSERNVAGIFAAAH
jgi:flavin-dependent dehydrogenase